MLQTLSNVEESLIVLLKDLASSLRHGGATIDVRRAPQIQHEGVSIALIPSNQNASPIVADATNRSPVISLVLGKSTLIEVVQRNETARSEEVRKICEAVIGGRFQEDLTCVGSEIMKCIGRIEIDGKIHVSTYRGRLFPFRRTQQRHMSYAPY
jgi:hypothetical protein